MDTGSPQIDRILGYLGLFVIGALGWVSDRLGPSRTVWPALPPRGEPSPAMREKARA